MGQLESSLGAVKGGLVAYLGNGFEGGKNPLGGCKAVPYTRSAALHFKSLFTAARQPNSTNGRFSTILRFPTFKITVKSFN